MKLSLSDWLKNSWIVEYRTTQKEFKNSSVKVDRKTNGIKATLNGRGMLRDEIYFFIIAFFPRMIRLFRKSHAINTPTIATIMAAMV